MNPGRAPKAKALRASARRAAQASSAMEAGAGAPMERLRAEARGFFASLRDSLVLWKLAPVIPALAAIPEFAQHVVEIRLGMFASRDAFAALGSDPARLSLGSVKVAGLVFAMLLAARFWANREAGLRSLSLAGIGWKQVLTGFLVQVVFTLPGLIDFRMPAAAFAISILATIASMPGLVLMVGGLLGDREAGLADAYRRGWGKALRMLIYIAPALAVLQPLHRWDHMVVLGQPQGLVWALMAWDALVVGLMAAVAGTGLHRGYTFWQRAG